MRCFLSQLKDLAPGLTPRSVFCSIYFVAYLSRTMFDFRRESATLTAWCQRRFENPDGPDGYPPKGLDVGA
jgi:hypothetical protein